MATRIVRELDSHVFGVARASWRISAPDASWRDYQGPRDFPPKTVSPRPDGLWCSVATDDQPDLMREAAFYGLRSELPFDCRLEQLRFVITTRQSDDDDVFEALASALTARFGPAFWNENEGNKRPSWLFPWSADIGYQPYTWKDTRFWSAPTQDVFLYHRDGTIQVLARDHLLQQALPYDFEIFEEYSRSIVRESGPVSFERAYGLGANRVTLELVNALRGRFPAAANLMLDNQAIPDQTLVRDVTVELLEALQGARSADERALLMVATDCTARRFHLDQPPSRLAELAFIRRQGVRFSESPYDRGVWYYDENFIEAAIRQYPGTRWGQLAFLSHLDEGWGWSMSVGSSYRSVIGVGVDWLGKHPRSPITIPVMYDVAQAFETWWSLSLATEAEELVKASEHRDGAEEARLEAIRWFERILRQAPDSVQAIYARRVLIQLRMRVDTGQRRFYSAYP
ncbi:MAG TPA: hypothetical protein VGY48_07780 [Vicinamibacterales bacterium]|nr:hypothetical protein [Vicinamibacterales bacterium]